MEQVNFDLNIGYSAIEGLNQGSEVLIGPDEREFMQVYNKNNAGFRCGLNGKESCPNRLKVFDDVLVLNGRPHCHGGQSELIASMRTRSSCREAARKQPSSNPMLQPLFNNVSSK
jgi:hypothetical protein